MLAPTKSINQSWWSSKNLKNSKNSHRDSADYISMVKSNKNSSQAASAIGQREGRESQDSEFMRYQLAGVRTLQSKSVLEQFHHTQGGKNSSQIVPAMTSEGHQTNTVLSAKRNNLTRKRSKKGLLTKGIVRNQLETGWSN